jgi:putative aldouronate transport system permease protein
MVKASKSYKIFQFFNTILLLGVIFITLYPLVYVFSQSLSSEKFVYAGEVTFFPKGFTLQTYKVVMSQMLFWNSYKNTILYTVTGTLVSVFFTAIFAYALSKKHLRGRGIFLGLAVFTMFFQGGLIPNYLLVKGLGFRNTIFSIIVPGAISTYNLLVMKTFFEGIPTELEEAASIDGYDTFKTFFRIIIPLSKPIISTMILFYAVAAWNNWFGPLLYFDDNTDFPLALYLRNIIAGSQATDLSSTTGNESALFQVQATIKSATIILSILPILCIYPFIQKYFIKGVMIGSVKG